MGQGSPRELVKAHGYAELKNRPRMLKESKWAKDAQEKKMGQKSPQAMKWVRKSLK